CAIALGLVAWLSNADTKPSASEAWAEVAPGVLRTTQQPFGYALVDDGHALLIDCPIPGDGLKAKGVTSIDRVLLTHHHRDSIAAVKWYLDQKVPVQAPKASAEWLTPDGVAKYWKESLPLRNSRTAYFVLPTGVEGVDCSLDDGQKIEWRGKLIAVVGTPGHSRDHVAYAMTLGKDTSPTVFSGDAFASTGKLWAPFTTDWDHWTEAGLKPTYESLRKLAALKPKRLLPAHGETINKDCSAVLETTAKAVEEVAFLKSFERFSKRLGDVPQYKFLVPKEQIASAGEKPWAKVSDHLWITGNTYVLVSKDEKAFLVMDPWGQRSIDQIAKLKKDEGLGALEVVMFSHAHYDHYDGVYLLADRKNIRVWTLDKVAEPIVDPNRLRAPFLDARPVNIDKQYRDGEAGTWREFTFKFHHFPGQTEFTMAVETTIDGKRCLFTADNFFHQDQFSGSGGWMGLNRSFPLPYAASAKKALDIAPEWILAEHGGPYEFNAEDYRRRVKWGESSAVAADAIAPSGSHRSDWDPNRVTAEPVLHKAKAGSTVKATLRVMNPGTKADRVTVKLDGRGVLTDQKWELDVGVGKTITQPFEMKLPADLKPGRYVFALNNRDAVGVEGCDAFVAVDVE
ncbi:MAG TPA: MBL fold metallo-hydrolase, partial [Gemmataceae bacterium]|nr:MBL fold metallo-hydrolase [Gemmataceae bacterium]